MPQQVKHTRDSMLDAARELILRGGPSAGSARAVAAAIGAPSGSVYHRFPQRDDLVAAAWLRAQDRFLDAFLAHLTEPSAESGVAAAVTVLTWSADHPQDASLLLRFALRDLLRGQVSAGLSEHAAGNERRAADAITRLAGALGRPLPDVVVAVVDLPYAVTRRVLRSTRPPTRHDADALRRAASLLLSAPEPPA